MGAYAGARRPSERPGSTTSRAPGVPARRVRGRRTRGRPVARGVDRSSFVGPLGIEPVVGGQARRHGSGPRRRRAPTTNARCGRPAGSTSRSSGSAPTVTSGSTSLRRIQTSPTRGGRAVGREPRVERCVLGTGTRASPRPHGGHGRAARGAPRRADRDRRRQAGDPATAPSPDPPTPAVPASFLQEHPDTLVIADRAAWGS